MNRTAIRNFAVWARKSLRDEVATNAARLGITRTKVTEPQVVAGGMVIGATTFDQTTTTLYRALRDDLGVRLRSKPLELVVDELVDEMAYTWFNRLAALRYLEVKGYLGRVLSSSTSGSTEPDLLRDALTLGDALPGLDAARIDALHAEGDEPLYRALLVAQCLDLAAALPDLFGDAPYAELFLPARLLTKGSLVGRLVHDIPEDDWRDIEIVGWLYQFYISERKDEVFALKKAYDARDIPAATQLFTPHWIVRYMVENSLGRLWLEAHPESDLRSQMPYYLESEQAIEPGTPKPKVELRPEELTVLDPACGSGHILVYAFDLLFAIYQEQGYPEPDIPALILEHNLHGLDIDERAAQLASFALMMKARDKNRRVLRNPPKLHVTYTVPTKKWTVPDVPELKRADWEPLLTAFRDADNLGSLISPPEVDEAALAAQLAAFGASGRLEVSADAPRLRHVLEQTRLLRRQYRAVIANPPYMGSSNFNKTVKDFINDRFPRSKGDIFAPFIERSLALTFGDGFTAAINQHSWMFLSGYESLRLHLLEDFTFKSMLHLGIGVFPELNSKVVQSTAFVIQNEQPKQDASAIYVRLTEKYDPKWKEQTLLNKENRYLNVRQKDFEKIPGSPIAYWVSERVLEVFKLATPLARLTVSSNGLQTSKNDRFVRYWFEIARVGLQKWIPYCKGGNFCRWYGNHEFVIDWSDQGQSIEALPSGSISGAELGERTGITWSDVTSGNFSARLKPSGHLFDHAGPSAFPIREITQQELLLFLNTPFVSNLTSLLNPTIHFQAGNFRNLPFIKPPTSNHLNTDVVYKSLVNNSKTDWDNFETSWDFQTHPLLRTPHSRLADAFTAWQETAEAASTELKRLEEENNRYWIDAYGLQDELTPDVPDEQITIRRASLVRDVKSLISYAVGCLMGRYSLLVPGLQFAGGTFNPAAFRGDLLPDRDGILPVTDEAYFGDDVVTGLERFLRAAYGAETLGANLAFIADALTRRADETPRERVRRYFLDEFISDHIQTYKKRPIYWLFTSGREKGFGAIVYLHRYTPDTLATLRNDYVLELQGKLAAELERVQDSLAGANARDAKLAERRLKRLRAQQTEVVGFQERLQTLADRQLEVDLDDGVAYNYTRFQGLVYEGPDLKMVDLLKKSEWKRDLLAQRP